MAAPVGATVTIAPYDFGKDDGPEAGDVLITYSERTGAFGTVYRIVTSRLMARSATPGRYSLRCQVLGRFEDVEHKEKAGPSGRFYTIVWTPRNRRRPR